MSKTRKRMKARRERLFNLNPICPFCGVKMILPKDTEDPKHKPDNMCTTEHVFTKMNPLRQSEVRRMNIVCCLKCNRERAYTEEAKLSKEERRLRAKHKA